MPPILDSFPTFDKVLPPSIPLDDVILSSELQVRHSSLEEVSLVLKESLKIPADEAKFKRMAQFGNGGPDRKGYDEEANAAFCERFFTQAYDSSNLPNSIDNAVLKALSLHSYSDSIAAFGLEAIVSRAHHLLNQLPVTSPQTPLNFHPDF